MALNYIQIKWKKQCRKIPLGIKSFWNFLWRWALLYIPVWALLMGFYFSLV